MSETAVTDTASSERIILLVEDDPISAETEKAALERLGYTVGVAATGEEGVRMSREMGRLDLVLMDVELGTGIDGGKAAELIIAERDIPVVFLSAHTEREYLRRIDEIASYGYVVKSSGGAVLESSLNIAFRLHAAQKALRESGEALRTAAEEKASLYKEFKHRVKNGMAMIYGLIGMETDAADRDEVRTALARTQLRLDALSSLYDLLGDSAGPESVRIDLYLDRILGSIAANAADRGFFDYSSNIEPCVVHARVAVPIGLLIMEIVDILVADTASVDHAAKVIVSLNRTESSGLRLEIKREGGACGFEEIATAGTRKALIDILVCQLKAIRSLDGESACRFVFDIPLPTVSL